MGMYRPTGKMCCRPIEGRGLCKTIYVLPLIDIFASLCFRLPDVFCWTGIPAPVIFVSAICALCSTFYIVFCFVVGFNCSFSFNCLVYC